MRQQVIGLCGVPQSGKTELEQAILASGWRWQNLNDTGDAMRAVGSPKRATFEALLPGVTYLGNNGKRHMPYYLAVQQDRGLLDRFTALEIQAITAAAYQGIATLPANEGLVMSWEQIHLLLPGLPLDHLVVLDCTDREVWGQRLSRRAMSRSWTGTEPPTPEFMRRLLCEVDFDPDVMIARLRALVPADRISIVDTSGEDWGEANLQAELRRLTSY